MRGLTIIGVCAAGLIFSANLVCANPFANLLLGKKNVEASQFLLECKHQEALAAIEKEENSDEKEYRKEVGLVIKGAIYKDMGENADFDTIYKSIASFDNGKMYKTEDDAKKAVEDMFTGLKLDRKKKTGSETCK